MARYEAAGGAALAYQDPRYTPHKPLDSVIDNAIGNGEELKNEMGDKYEELGEMV